MKYLIAVLAVIVGITGSVAGQVHENKAKPSTTRADLAPKSTVAARDTTPAASSSSKELKTIERHTPKGASHTGQKTRAVAIKPDSSDKNPPVNFGAKSSPQGVGLNKQANPYKGRLKQKGAGRSY